MTLKISESFNDFALHDGAVESITFSPGEHRLEMYVALTAESNDEVGWYGTMVFYDVHILQSSHDLQRLNWDKIDWANIASSDYKPESDASGLQAVFWAIALHYENTSEEYLILEYLAKDFDWFPDRSRPSRFIE